MGISGRERRARVCVFTAPPLTPPGVWGWGVKGGALSLHELRRVCCCCACAGMEFDQLGCKPAGRLASGHDSAEASGASAEVPRYTVTIHVRKFYTFCAITPTGDQYTGPKTHVGHNSTLTTRSLHCWHSVRRYQRLSNRAVIVPARVSCRPAPCPPRTGLMQNEDSLLGDFLLDMDFDEFIPVSNFFSRYTHDLSTKDREGAAGTDP